MDTHIIGGQLEAERGGAGQIEATLNYLAAMVEKPVAYNYPPPPGVPQRTGEFVPRRVAISNGRGGDFSLDREGFALVDHVTAVEDLYDDAAVKAVYYPEMVELVGGITGAEKVIVFDHTVRAKPEAGRR